MRLVRFCVYSFVFLILLWLTFAFFNGLNFQQEERWNWDSFIFLTPHVPERFIWGTADSAFQTEGTETVHGACVVNSWTAWEQEEIITPPSYLSLDWILYVFCLKTLPKRSRISTEKRAGFACHRWSHYKEDIQLLKHVGMNAHRFSIEWSKIEPSQGTIDYDALKHYIDYTKEMINNNIQPIVTLFHHTLPLWFADKGGFEKTENIKDFVAYATFIVTSFKQAGLLKQAKLWITLNEPIGYALAAYVQGSLPPGKKLHLGQAGVVAKNLLDAHCAIYDQFKAIDPSLQLSFAHAMNPISPYHPWNPLDAVPAKIFDYLVNDVALEYFKTGNFYWLSTSLTNFFHDGLSIYSKQYNPSAQGKLDWVGVNYYSHTLLKMFKEASRPKEVLADGYPVKKIKAIYPEGFYHSLKKASILNLPIIVTENGFSSPSDELRTEYLKKHLYVLAKALQEGLDIRGYLFWTLTDCFGWDSGQKSIHGMYSVNPLTQERMLKSNVHCLLEAIKNSSPR